MQLMTSFPMAGFRRHSPQSGAVEHWEHIYGLHGNSTRYEMLGKMKQGNLRNEKEKKKEKQHVSIYSEELLICKS